MNSRKTILVVVPDHDLRRSLSYMLEAEGLAVLAHPDLETAVSGPRSDKFHCAVVDEDAIEGHHSGWRLLSEMTEPIIILWNRLRRIPDNFAATFLDKPLLGKRVVEAVLQNLDMRVEPPTT